MSGQFTRWSLATSAAFVFVGAICTVANVFCAPSATAFGTVLDQIGLPIPSAAVGCASGKKSVTRGIEPVDIRGQFKLVTDSSITHLTCIFSAPNYEQKTRTIPINNGIFDFSEIRLNKIAHLAASPLVRSLTADSRYLILDTVVSNSSTKPIDTVSLQVNASALRSTSCFDPRPAIIFKVEDNLPIKRLQDSESSLSVNVESPPTNWTETTLAKGQLEKLGCRQQRLTLRINYLAHFNPGDHEKIRFALPQQFGAEGAKPVQITLSSWEAIEIKLILADGSTLNIH